MCRLPTVVWCMQHQVASELPDLSVPPSPEVYGVPPTAAGHAVKYAVVAVNYFVGSQYVAPRRLLQAARCMRTGIRALWLPFCNACVGRALWWACVWGALAAR
jgi:hypothetical protein